MSARVWNFVAAAYLTLCLVLGGASAAGAVANAILQVLAVLIIVAILWRREPGPLHPEAREFLWIWLGGVVLVMLSLVPLPPNIWQSLPFRGSIAGAFGMLGIRNAWLPLSLAPQASLASVLTVLPPLAMFLLTARLPPDGRRTLAAVVVGVALASVVLGAFQLLGGPQSGLRFYRITNPDSLVGFFANANHQATLLLSALAFASYLVSRGAASSRPASRRRASLILGGSAAFFLVLGLALVGSEAGYGLFLMAAFGSVLIYRRAVVGKVTRRWIAALGVLSVLFLILATAGPLSREALSAKYTEHPTSRGVISDVTAAAIEASFPVGTGLGTFANVYRLYEDPSRARSVFVNHAHNDYLEVVLELGLPGAVLILIFLTWWARRAFSVWAYDQSGASLGRAGSLVIGIVLLHSIVDYPLRTAAIASLFAAACALLTRNPPPKAKGLKLEKGGGNERLRHLQAD